MSTLFDLSIDLMKWRVEVGICAHHMKFTVQKHSNCSDYDICEVILALCYTLKALYLCGFSKFVSVLLYPAYVFIANFFQLIIFLEPV